MSIIVKVKGVDDFGKEAINSKLSKYSQHYPRPRVNDIMIYYYPKGKNGPSLGIYQMKEETEHYEDREGFQYCSGTMTNLVGTGSPNDFIDNLFKTNPEVAKRIDDTVYELGLKYNPELYEDGKTS